MKYYHPDFLDFGLDRIRAKIAAGNTVKLHILKAYAAGDSYATAFGNSIGSVALAEGDLTLGNQGTNGRQVAVASKNLTASGASEQYDSGTATAGGANTLTDSGKAWSVNGHAGRAAKIVGGTGAGQSRRIASNTATQLTVTVNWTTPPDATSQYQILDDVHFAILDETESKVLVATDEDSNQVITAGNPVTTPAWAAKQNQPA